MSERHSGARTLNTRVRIICCPACKHEGPIPESTATTARVRCRACGERWLVCEATMQHPRRRPSAAKSAAAKEVLARYGELPDDSVTDLWRPAAT
jgi:DNA-directed RNA polymerase subunit RPC12/RpoP